LRPDRIGPLGTVPLRGQLVIEAFAFRFPVRTDSPT
jgi:hypothetical protein